MALPYNFGVPTVAPSPAPPDDYQHLSTNAGMFGGEQAQALRESAANLNRTSDNLGQAADIRQDRYNQVAGTEAYNQLQDAYYKKQFGDPDVQGDKGIYGLKSRAAMDAGPAVIQSLNGVRQQIRDGLHNEAQRLLFDQNSRRLQVYTADAIGRHIDQETNAWGLETAKSQTNNAERNSGAFWNDPTQFNASIEQARHGAISEIQSRGVTNDPDIVKDIYNQHLQRVIMSRAQSWAASGDVAGALEWLQNGKTPPITTPDGQQTQGMPFSQIVDPHIYSQFVQHYTEKADGAVGDEYVRQLLGGGGTPSAPTSRDNNVGNIRHTNISWEGKGEPTNGFETFETPEAGVKAAVQNLQSYATKNGGQVSLQDAITRWAPPSENDTAAYIKRVSSETGLSPGAPLPLNDPAQMANVVKAMTRVEKGRVPFSDDVFRAGATAAIQGAPAKSGVPAASVSPQAAYPDESALVRHVLDDPRLQANPKMQQEVLSKLTRQMSIIKLATATDRDDLVHSIPDIQAAAEAGQDVTIPEDRIHRLLPPADAARTIENLHIAQDAGQILKGVQWGTPEQVQSAWKDLSSGLGPLSTMINKRSIAGGFGPPGQAEAGSDKETPEAYRIRTRILSHFEQIVQARNGQLSTDPAAYVLQAPTVATARAALDAAPTDADKTDATRAYVTAQLAAQKTLGVPDDQQHIMTKTEAQGISHKLMTTDPATTDMGRQLAGVAQQYGDAWPKAFGDLVTLGKLPGEYQILASMPDPVQRTTFQRALMATVQRGGAKQLREDIPKLSAQTIDDGLDDKINDFRRTVAIPGLTNNVGLLATVRDAIKTYAYFDALQSGDPNKALSNATDAVLNSKYDFDGTMRVPKGLLPVAETATGNLVSNLKPADLMPLAADTMATAAGPGLTVEQRQSVTLDAAQRGKWVPNESDTGLLLAGQLRNGAMVLMRHPDGSRIQLLFKDMAAPAQASTQPAPNARLNMLTGSPF